MSAAVKQMETTLADLQRQLSAIDLPAARARADELDLAAEAAKREHETPIPGHVGVARDSGPRIAAAQNAKAARQHVVSLEGRQSELRRDIERLSGMVFAQDRIKQGEAAAAAVAALVDSTAVAVEAAKQTVNTLDGLIQQEQELFEAARGAAAAQLLARVKAGGSAGQVTTPNLDKLATLELAREDAQHELAAAEAAHQAAKTQASAARGQVAVALAGATALAHELAFAAYVDALVEHQVAHWNAFRQGFHPPSPLEAARSRVEKRQA